MDASMNAKIALGRQTILLSALQASEKVEIIRALTEPNLVRHLDSYKFLPNINGEACLLVDLKQYSHSSGDLLRQIVIWVQRNGELILYRGEFNAGGGTLTGIANDKALTELFETNGWVFERLLQALRDLLLKSIQREETHLLYMRDGLRFVTETRRRLRLT